MSADPDDTLQPTSYLTTPPTHRRTERWLHILFPVAVLALAIALVSALLAFRADDHAISADRKAADAKQQARTLYSQAASAGVTPSVTPPGVAPASVIPGRPGSAGLNGLNGTPGAGPSDAQVLRVVTQLRQARPALFVAPVSFTAIRAAVLDVCGTSRCRGGTGVPGRSGGPGEPGASGTPGPTGTAGASGDPGPGPTDEQIAAAVRANCGGSCIGPSGPAGASGASGASGQPGPACPSGYSPQRVDPPPGLGPSYVQCQADPAPASSSATP